MYVKGETRQDGIYKVYTIDRDEFDENDYLFCGYISVCDNKVLRNKIIKFLNKEEKNASSK